MIAARPALSRRLRMMGAAISIGAASMLSSAPAFARGPDGIADIAEKVIDAVVNISTSQKVEGRPGPGAQQMPNLPPGSPFEEFFDDFFKNRRGPPGKGGDKSGEFQPRKTNSLGSGFIVDTAGIVVTNNHVIDGADQVKVSLADKREFEVDVVLKDARTDLAVLRVKDGKERFPVLEFSNSDELQVGDVVLAVGNPFGLAGTATAGIVSARGRDIGAGPYDDFIQIDAPVNKGNSGGPAFDVSGEVMGVNTAIYSPSGGSVGIAFSIPAQTVKSVVAQLKDKGSVSRGWIGVQIQPVTSDIADSLGMKKAEGALVAEPQANGPAAKAGIVGMTKAAAKEMAHHGVRVNAVAPGLIRSAMTEAMPQKAWDQKMAEIPMGRAGEVSEVATVALFLASHLSSYMTGTVMEVTGGRFM